ncbi:MULTISPECIES: hypothetical protein [Pseudoxanthomonas]|uniref:Polysaccharide biosynthesis protein n=1 Tax=Pseudoxanthomonas winnipegensis TaxID=2480810 RepID=A0AAW8GCP7_9GAMM|nr:MULTISPECIES: hypothetical protein [Pseudoxanthomonas]MDQ1118938.1 hypothetical protein [Pseudoxanthomonas winnipegensis]MDQ1132126.1 hypothetical protein [Pseudoxanthomonas winnipegensis]MDR6137862.1 hypothetical protein [Pseudoxanthomonas sp. SORGH_AS_0997]
MSAAGRMRAAFASGALLYALGQGCTLLFQWLLLRQFGLRGYGEVGLAHLGLTTVLFLGDLGYASLFLREDPAAPGWEMRWRQALRHRLFATLALDLAWVVAAGWSWRGRGEGFGYVLAALPATLFGLIGYSAPLLAQGRRLPGFAVQQIAMPVAIVVWWPLRHLPGWEGGVGAGLAVSIGYLVQAALNTAVFAAPLRLLWPQRGRSRHLLATAVQLSLLGIVGIVHDRLTPLLLAAVAPAFLPVYLFLGYLLNGASGMFNQFNRLLLAEAASDTGQRWAQALISVVLGGAALGALLLPLATATWGNAGQHAWLPWATPVLAGGATVLLSGVLAALLIGRHRERALLRLLLIGVLCSALLQLAAAAWAAPQVLLWGRLLCLLGIAAASLHLCGLRLNGGGVAALLAALLAASLWGGRLGWAFAAVLLLPALWTAWRRHSLFAPAAERTG